MKSGDCSHHLFNFFMIFYIGIARGVKTHAIEPVVFNCAIERRLRGWGRGITITACSLKTRK